MVTAYSGRVNMLWGEVVWLGGVGGVVCFVYIWVFGGSSVLNW